MPAGRHGATIPPLRELKGAGSTLRQQSAQPVAQSTVDGAIPVPHDLDSRPLRWNRRDAVALIALLVLCAAFFYPLYALSDDQRRFIASGDFTNQFYPYHFYAAAEWAARRIPLWNPYMFGGHPFQADIQTAVFYPLSLIVNFVFGRHGLSFQALEIEGVANYVLAAMFSYAFARTALRDRLAATLVAICFALGGYLTSYPLQQLAILETAVWLPLVLLMIELGCHSRRASYAWWALAGLVMAVSVLGGHPQSAMFIGYTSVAYLIFRVRSRSSGWRSAIAGALLFSIVAGGASAVQLLPTFELTGLSTRATMSYDVAATGYEYQSLPGLLLPYWRDEKALYLGIVPLLSIVFAVRSFRRPAVAFWLVAALVALALSFGDRGILYRLCYSVVPGFGMFKGQERAALVFSLAGAMLAGYGITALRRMRVRPPAVTLASLCLAILAGFGIALFWPSNDKLAGKLDVGMLGLPQLSVLLVLATTALLLTWFFKKRKRSHLEAVALLALVALAAADLFVTNWQNNMSTRDPQIDQAQKAAVTFLLDRQAREGEPIRVRPQNEQALPANYGSMAGLPLAAGDTPITVRRTEDLFGSTEEWRLWQLLNVKYLVSFGQPTEALEEIATFGQLKVYRNRFSLPRAWVVTDYTLAGDANAARLAVLSPDFNPGKTAILEHRPDQEEHITSPEQPPLDQKLVFDYYSPRRVFLHTTTNRDGILLLSEIYYPGWHARLDGQPVDLRRADYVLRAVELPAGDHQVEMVFDPSSFWLGLAITILTFGTVGLACLWHLRRGAPSRKVSRS